MYVIYKDPVHASQETLFTLERPVDENNHAFKI